MNPVLASMDTVLNILKTILGIGGLIFLHELGHFLVGRWCGVRAEAFSIGMGPVIAKWAPGETEYRLSAIPLGGYVKFLGENPDERGERDPRSFHAATYPRKVAILLAGVTMNVITAFALFAVTYWAGWETTPAVIGHVAEGLPAWQNGLREGDEILTVNGRRVLDFSDMRYETTLAREVEIGLRRDGKLLTTRFATYDAGEGLHQIGVAPVVWNDGRVDVDPSSEAGRAGFQRGDRVVAIDGAPAATLEQAEKLYVEAGKDTVWTVERDGRRIDLRLPWRVKPHAKIGVEFRADAEAILVRRDGPAAAAGLMSGDRPVSVGGVATASAGLFVRMIRDPSVCGPAIVRRGSVEVRIELPAGPERADFGRSVAWRGTGPSRMWLAEGPSPAREQALPDGALALQVDGRPVTSDTDVADAVKSAFAENRPVALTWRDLDGREGTSRIAPRNDPYADIEGLGPLARTEVFREPNVFAAAALGADRTVRWVVRIADTLGSILSGHLSGSKLSGPIGIARVTFSAAKSSWGDFLMFLGMISMNLAFLNVLPLPLLDGGQLAVHTVEKLRGRPIPERVLEGVMWAGIVLLLALLVYVTRNDIVAGFLRT